MLFGENRGSRLGPFFEIELGSNMPVERHQERAIFLGLKPEAVRSTWGHVNVYKSDGY